MNNCMWRNPQESISKFYGNLRICTFGLLEGEVSLCWIYIFTFSRGIFEHLSDTSLMYVYCYKMGQKLSKYTFKWCFYSTICACLCITLRRHVQCARSSEKKRAYLSIAFWDNLLVSKATRWEQLEVKWCKCRRSLPPCIKYAWLATNYTKRVWKKRSCRGVRLWYLTF